MSTTAFADCTDTSLLDPSKHVNFVQGMVLGVDDFKQEFAWHAGRHEMLARDLAGYGTVCGLRLGVDDNGTANPIVAVEPGLAVTPPGRFARVTRRQCASLREWLSRAEIRDRLVLEPLGSPGRDYVRVYVRLAYRDCLTDQVPIPGEPCRTEDETMQPSRVADSWRLHLDLEPPRQFEENAVRVLVHWLKRIPIVEHPAATPETVAQALRDAVSGVASPPSSPVADNGNAADEAQELLLANPPSTLAIAREDLCECLRAALRVWVTELRQTVQEKYWRATTGCGCDGGSATSLPATPGPEDDLLLGELWVPAETLGSSPPSLDPSDQIQIHEENRPYLLHTRLVQELVTCGPDATGVTGVGAFATVLATADNALLLWAHHPMEIDPSAVGAITVDVNGTVATDLVVAPLGGSPNVFTLAFDGSPPNALAHGDRVTLRFDLGLIIEQPANRTLREALDATTTEYLDRSGDTIVIRTIVGMLSLNDLIDVDTADAAEGEVLTFRNGVWVPEPSSSQQLALEDLTDVEMPSPGPGAGDALVFRNGVWVPEPRNSITDHNALQNLTVGNPHPQYALVTHTHALNDLSDVDTGPAPVPNVTGPFLFFDGTQWVRANIPPPTGGGTPTPVNSGIIRFRETMPGTQGVFGPFTHGFNDQIVMIRLGLEEFPDDQPFELAENTDTAGTVSAFYARTVAVYVAQSPQFFVYFHDPRPDTAPRREWIVRWFAIPVTRRFPPQEAKRAQLETAPGVVSNIALRMVLAEVGAGTARVADLASRLGVTADEIRPVLKDLQDANLIRVTRDIITPIN